MNDRYVKPGGGDGGSTNLGCLICFTVIVFLAGALLAAFGVFLWFVSGIIPESSDSIVIRTTVIPICLITAFMVFVGGSTLIGMISRTRSREQQKKMDAMREEIRSAILRELKENKK